MAMKMQIKNLKRVQKELKRLSTAAEKTVNDTAKEFRQRAPGWIETEVRKQYAISKGDLINDKLGEMKVTGDGKQSAILYTGERLSPVHFGMKPTTPPGAPYRLKAKITGTRQETLGQVKKLTKKQKRNIGRNFTHQSTQTSQRSPYMLMHTGNKKGGGVDYIPFQRQSTRRTDIHPFRTVAMPQMMSHDGKTLKPEINEVVQAKLEKRLDHYLDRNFGK